MTSGIAFGSRRIGAGMLMLVLVALAITAALLTPEIGTGGGFSSQSTEPAGLRITVDLAKRMGWRVDRRVAPLDSSAPTTSVQAVIAPRGPLGAHEVHRLLDNVRRGGGLLFTIESNDEIADSLGLAVRPFARYLETIGSRECGLENVVRLAQEFPPRVYAIVWRRPPPSVVRTLARAQLSTESQSDAVGVGFRLGQGRVAAISSNDVFANSSVRVCRFGADVAVARALEYVQPDSGASQALVFDEFHHGDGFHGGTIGAITTFLAHTPPGRFLAEALVAALLLLIAAAPRPIAPVEPLRIARRSPLEHADALGHAYSDVGATRTATSRLVSGLRRRASRVVQARHAETESAFLDAAVHRDRSLADPVAVVRRALDQTVTPRELIAVGRAIETIEQSLSSPPLPKT